MSFVLDALKRSERDRHQGQIPNLASESSLVHLSKPQRSIWPYLLIVVLCVNAGVFLFIYWPTSQNDVSNSVNVDPVLSQMAEIQRASGQGSMPVRKDSESVDTQKVAEKAFSNERGAPSLAKAKTISDNQAIDWERKKLESQRLITASLQNSSENSAEKPAASTIESLRQEPEYYEDVPTRIDPFQAPRPYNEDRVAENLEQFDRNGFDVIRPKNGNYTELPPSLAQSNPETNVASSGESSELTETPFLYEIAGYQQPRVPSLRFNSHIYSDTPSARRVMINNIYLREGQSFNGIDVLEIGENNILFQKDSVKFKLPAMRDWDG